MFQHYSGFRRSISLTGFYYRRDVIFIGLDIVTMALCGGASSGSMNKNCVFGTGWDYYQLVLTYLNQFKIPLL